ncbi:hypothetical protein ABZ714_16240 [Streptomyces sp. NPDC006798]|uniref:HAAS signaling domain-containing protein n=1 Tax=Streptomyces sp. NPDC006798 TaxID=3155462 RepID=UPI0033F8FEB1
MKTSADPVHDYLAAVEREGSALPADRRQELVADLAEHIEIARAERPDTPVGEILAELGDPRTIAATALAEAGHGTTAGPGANGTPAWSTPEAPARRGKVHPLVPLVMLTLSVPFIMIFPEQPGPIFGVLSRVVGAVLLCTSAHWTAVRKTTGVLLLAVLPTAIITSWNLGGGPISDAAAFLANLVTFVLLTGVATWLWRSRRDAA